MSYVAYHFHWPLTEILDLEHPLRHAFVTQIGQINERIANADNGTTGITDAAEGW